MAAGSLYPGFARAFYTVANLPHVMTLPLRAYDPPPAGGSYGQVTLWDDTVEDADTNLEAKITGWADLFTTDANFSTIFWYTMASPTAEPILAAAKNIDIDGTYAITAGEDYLTVQTTFSFLDTAGNKVKRSFMEATSRNTFEKFTNRSLLTADEDAVVAEMLAVTTPFASYHNLRPYIWTSMTRTLNEKLRRERRRT